jgi:hypothetical protein
VHSGENARWTNLPNFEIFSHSCGLILSADITHKIVSGHLTQNCQRTSYKKLSVDISHKIVSGHLTKNCQRTLTQNCQFCVKRKVFNFSLKVRWKKGACCTGRKFAELPAWLIFEQTTLNKFETLLNWEKLLINWSNNFSQNFESYCGCVIFESQ